MELEEFVEKRLTVLRVSGRCVPGEVDRFILAARDLLCASHTLLVIDLHQAAGVCSTYLAACVEIHGKARELEKSLTFFVSPQLARAIKICGLNHALRVMTIRRRHAGTGEAQ
jgi:hypothetical protein